MIHVTGAPHLHPVAIGTLSALLWSVDALAREENERVQLHDGGATRDRRRHDGWRKTPLELTIVPHYADFPEIGGNQRRPRSNR
jgi:hypothetical protein